MIKLLNTMTGQKEEFIPTKNTEVNMFVCGPTVYDYIHIGNARTFVFFDVVTKYLLHKGYKVNYIQNITDIDNKIIERAEKEGIDPLEHARKYTELFKEDVKALGVTSPEYKNATDHIPQVIKQVQTLLSKGNAYVIDNSGIYFDLSTFPDYGKLSGRTAGMADDAVSRIDDSEKKRNRGDFALWKFSQDNDPSWPAPFGAGRPGWHIEDTAITEHHFGPQYDIHGGGQDLIFPHHEAEIAQQESASGLKPFVKHWMHVGFLVNKEQKMSKSLGNFMTLHEALEKWPKEALRFYLLSNHYRSPLQFSEEIVKQAQAAVQRIAELNEKLKLTKEENNTDLDFEFDKMFQQAMDDDFNTPKALSVIFGVIKSANEHFSMLSKKSREEIKRILSEVNSIFGIIPQELKIPKEILKLVEQREELRHTKDYGGADKIRAQIEEMGYKIDDTIYGPLTGPR
ncbi:MAG: cysteine--tRNA ligase [Candidatus Paceibacterota bacterium]